MRQAIDTPTKPGKRIAVLGTCGSGKTFVAKRLAELLDIPYICSDAILWGPNWTLKSSDEQLAGYDEATCCEAWTFDGNLGTASKAKNALVLDRVDTLIWLDLPLRTVLPQLLKRTIRRAWTQEELWHGNRESFRLSLFSTDSILLWALRTYRSNRTRYTELFNDPNHAHQQRIRFRSRRVLNAWLAGIEEKQKTQESQISRK